MAEQVQPDDQGIYTVVQKIIGDLLQFDQYSRLRVYRTVGAFFDLEDSYPKVTQDTFRHASSGNVSREPRFSSAEELTPKDFLFQKQPNTDIERIACLAYYLTHYRDTPHFNTTDVSKLNTEAAQIKLSNPSYSVNNATKAGMLAAATKGMKQLSAQGEKYVEVLPDRPAAKGLLKPRTKSKRAHKSSSVDRPNSTHVRERDDLSG